MSKIRLFCITGKLQSFAKKKDAWREITKRGWHVTDTLTRSCDVLVVADSALTGPPTGKIRSAQCAIKEGSPLEIIGEAEFLDRLNKNPIINPDPPENVITTNRERHRLDRWTIEVPEADEFCILRIKLRLYDDAFDVHHLFHQIDHFFKDGTINYLYKYRTNQNGLDGEVNIAIRLETAQKGSDFILTFGHYFSEWCTGIRAQWNIRVFSDQSHWGRSWDQKIKESMELPDPDDLSAFFVEYKVKRQ